MCMNEWKCPKPVGNLILIVSYSYNNKHCIKKKPKY